MARQLREKVREALLQRCLKKGGTFKLASGKESNVYVDSKGITLHASSLKLLSEYFWEVWSTQKMNPSSIAGVSVGGDPLATALALEGMEQGEKNILLVRKEKKDHGGTQGRAVEGLKSSDLRGPLFLVEDVMSTGGSSAKALRFLKEEGYKVDAAWVILDREMGAKESLEKEFGIPVYSLFKLSDLV